MKYNLNKKIEELFFEKFPPLVLFSFNSSIFILSNNLFSSFAKNNIL